MVKRTFWLELLESAWARGSMVWLAGVRGVGKTSLCQSLSNLEYFHCELPQVRRQMEDPEKFLGKLTGKRIVLDEVHRLPHSTEILKMAGDHSPSLKVIATGPVSLRPFVSNDKPAGKVTPVWLTPMMSRDLVDFGKTDLVHRLLRGGLPSFFLSSKRLELGFQDWLDSFWAKDIQEVFRLESRSAFQTFLGLLFSQSGKLFEASRFAAKCEVSRPTIMKYLTALEATRAVQVIPPFSTQRPVEIISAPKVYAFDTGFLCYFRRWQQLREEDFEVLWRHWVLNEIGSLLQAPVMQYWRDKRGHEVDFVWTHREMGIMTLTAQWKAKDFEPKNLQAFRFHYPSGPNWIVCHDMKRGHTRSLDKLKVEFLSLEEMGRRLSAAKAQPRETKTYF